MYILVEKREHKLILLGITHLTVILLGISEEVSFTTRRDMVMASILVSVLVSAW